MKAKLLTLIAVLFLFLKSSISSQTVDILNFTCDNTLQCSPGNTYMQDFTMPAGDDYYITQMGIQIGDQSQDGKIFLGIYNAAGDLLFKSDEIIFTGGVETTLMVDIAPGNQDLKTGEIYYAAMIYEGTDWLYFRCKTGATNTGIGINLNNALFNTTAVYPDFPNPREATGNWALNLGFIITGEVITTPIVPKDEILDFNCTDYIQISTGTIVSDYITMPSGSDHELRHIGIKTDTCSANGPLKFAVYNSSLGLLYVTDELTVNGDNTDTTYVVIPAATVMLEAETSYYIAMQYNGTEYLHVLFNKNPVSKGIASVYDHSLFNTGQTYPVFPDPITFTGNWGLTLGFVMNGDEPLATPVPENKSLNNKIKAFPTVADNAVWLYTQEIIKGGASVVIYNMNGQMIKSLDWNEDNSLQIDVNDLSTGPYLIRVVNQSFEAQTIKFIKK
ncbi:MAG: T9SS type A sorting domain-containing protein [Bacteroidales bacterium]|nr:T9SS type A sorting domain-containing protein [Bacteroidales bacterium]